MGRWDDDDDEPPLRSASASAPAPPPPAAARPTAAQRALAEAAAFAAARAAAKAAGGAEEDEGPVLASSPSASESGSGGAGAAAAAATTAVSGAGGGGSTGRRGGGDGPAASSRWADDGGDAAGGGGAPSVVGPAASPPPTRAPEAARTPQPPPPSDAAQKTPPPPPTSALVSMLAPCRAVDCYERIAKIAEGAYGVVYKARDRATGTVVALKKIKMDGAAGGGDGFPVTSLREVNILLACHHPAIVNVAEVVVGASLDAVYVAMEFCPHDLKGVATLLGRPFTVAETKCVVRQLLAGAAFLHASWVLHRDIKPANVLVGPGPGVFKLADFGLARRSGSPRPARLTTPVVTLYYRAPELLLGATSYGPEVDVWSLGCVLAELLLGRVLFEPAAGARDGEIGQMDAISRVLGPVNEDTLPGCSSLPGLKSMRYAHRGTGLRSLFPAPGVGLDASARLSDAGVRLLSSMLAYDPAARISAADALAHDWFREFPGATDPALMPSFPAGKKG